MPPPNGDLKRAAAPVRIGIIGDVQYADVPDGTDFSGCEKRYFRNALKILEAAVQSWNEVNVDVVVQMGDVIDGCNKARGTSEAALATVLRAFAAAAAPRRYDLIGNHELYNFQREDMISQGLYLGESKLGYYSVDLGPGWEALFLDAYEHALIGYSDGHPCLNEAIAVIQAKNPQVVSGKPGDWFRGLPEEKHRYVPYNGGVSKEQLAWLAQKVAQAAEEGKSVLVFTHIPLMEASTNPKTVLWNAEEVLSVLHGHSDTVVAVIAGHDHNGGYAVDRAGLHHLTMNSPLTAQPGTDCWAVLECHEGWARLQSYGRVCVESRSHGQGRAYSELILAKGAVNTPV